MDIVQHAFVPAVAVYAQTQDPIQASIVGLIAASPDVIGAYGYWRYKNYDLRVVLHNFDNRIEALASGILACVVGFIIGGQTGAWIFSMGEGFLGFAIHTYLDTFCHPPAPRWWYINERFWIEAAIWVGLIGVASFVNYYFLMIAVVTLIVASLVTFYNSLTQ